MKRYLYTGILLFFSFLRASAQFVGDYNVDHALSQASMMDASSIYVKISNTLNDNSRVREQKNILTPEDLKKWEAVGEVVALSSPSLMSNIRSAQDRGSILDGIYKLKLSEGANLRTLISEVSKYQNVKYAEPAKIYELLYLPNDPAASIGSQQFYLSNIHAYEAWEITKGDSLVTIAVIDTGMDPDHEDLAGAIQYNSGDIINGLDDDGDGYIDNYVGWDFADDDNDVSTGMDDHGTLVAGIGGADTNNGIGIAGVGFSSRLMPLKIFKSDDNEFNNGFEAIIYAANKGCQVINLSWGSGENYFSQFEQDVIDYAVIEKDVVIVAAGGNTNEELDFLPASYNNVLSVGAVDKNDGKASWATYSTYIDLLAPGEAIYTTARDDQYVNGLGTSFTTPQVAGAASLIRAKYPGWSARQVMEQLRVTADPVYDIGDNSIYDERLGTGRLNMEQALTDTLSQSVRVTEVMWNTQFGQFAFYGDTLAIVVDLINFLGKVENLKVTLRIITDNALMIDSVFQAGSLDAMDSINNSTNPFRVVLSEDIEHFEKLKFRVGFKGEGYSDYQYFEFYSTPGFFDIDNQTVTMTVSNDGSMGYYGDYHQSGNGVLYKEQQLVKDLGILFGKDKDHLLDNVLFDLENHIRDHDFKSDTRIKLYGNSMADLDARSRFSESDSTELRMDVVIEQKILAWEQDSISSFQILEYRFINNKAESDSNLYYGIYADWDLDSETENKCVWDPLNQIGIVYNVDSSLFAGIAMLTDSAITSYGVDLDSQNGNQKDFERFFTDSLKFKYLSNGFDKTNAGTAGNGNDVAVIVGSKIEKLEPFGTHKAAVVIVIGESYQYLINNLENARKVYSYHLINPPITGEVYTCRGDSAYINPDSGQWAFFADPFGDSLLHIGHDYRTPPVYSDTSIFLMNLDSNFHSDISQVKIILDDPNAAFDMIPDTLIIEPEDGKSVNFVDRSKNAGTWEWDFGNGYRSSLKNPSTEYSEKGVYSVKLVVSNSSGCQDSIINNLTVFEKGPGPIIVDQFICKGDSIWINPSNTGLIRVYSDDSLNHLVHEGEIFVSGPFFTDTVFFVTNIDSLIESTAVSQHVFVSQLFTSFNVIPDTRYDDERYLVNLVNQSENFRELEWFVNDTLYSSVMDTVFDYTELLSFQVRLTAYDSMECVSTNEETIIPGRSPKPYITNFYACCGQDILIQPSNGAVFSFFEDAEGDSWLGKGAFYLVDSALESGSIWVAGLDSLLEGELVEAIWHISDVKTEFTIYPNPLNIREGNTVQFKDISRNVHTRVWEFEINGIDTIATPVREYFDVGEYRIYLTVTDSLGCLDSYQDTLEVVNTVGIDDQDELFLNIYPNPAGSIIYIENRNSESQQWIINLLSLDGVMIQKFQVEPGQRINELQVQPLNSGVYILEFSSEKHHFSKKMIINN